MHTKRGLDRLVFFTDAVSAIAITLLILPLVDSAATAGGKVSVGSFLADNVNEMFAFLLSFAVIARLWAANHSLFEHVASYNRPLFTLNLVWALTIVILPLPTEMISQFSTSGATVGIYIGTMLASSVALLFMAITIRLNPEIAAADNPIVPRTVFSIGATAVAFFAALVVGVLVPAINFYALILVFVAAPAGYVYDLVTGRKPRKS